MNDGVAVWAHRAHVGDRIDFMLAAICQAYRLPATPALVMFAAGRLAGWLAHALEQQEQGGLIRPRARYAGAPPATPATPE